ncbi:MULTISPECIES: hypothetical protein [unclassified Enterococcus]|nr:MULTISPECIES: hypothetical protein [unclassified Enterococcus]
MGKYQLDDKQKKLNQKYTGTAIKQTSQKEKIEALKQKVKNKKAQ